MFRTVFKQYYDVKQYHCYYCLVKQYFKFSSHYIVEKLRSLYIYAYICKCMHLIKEKHHLYFDDDQLIHIRLLSNWGSEELLKNSID